MKLSNLLISWGAYLLLEKPVKNIPLSALSDQLKITGQELNTRLANSSATSANQSQLIHIIGIERWGQRRIRVALGEPYLAEEYDHYKPPNDRSWKDLIADWVNTRNSTLELINELIRNNIPEDITIQHNQYGRLNVKGWLRYLDLHASGEGKRIK